MKRHVLILLGWTVAAGLSCDVYAQRGTGGGVVAVGPAPRGSVARPPTAVNPMTPGASIGSPGVAVPGSTAGTERLAPILPETGATGNYVPGQAGAGPVGALAPDTGAGGMGLPAGPAAPGSPGVPDNGITGGTGVPAAALGPAVPGATPPVLAPGEIGAAAGSVGSTAPATTGTAPAAGGTVTVPPISGVTAADNIIAQQIRAQVLNPGSTPGMIGARNPAPNLGGVQISINNGVVTLRGMVQNPGTRQLLINQIRTMNGVQSVVDALTVNPNARSTATTLNPATQAQIMQGNLAFAQQIRTQLVANDRNLARTTGQAIPAPILSRIQVLANNGVVTLRGVVANSTQQLLLLDQVRRVPGVRAVVNGLIVNPNLAARETIRVQE